MDLDPPIWRGGRTQGNGDSRRERSTVEEEEEEDGGRQGDRREVAARQAQEGSPDQPP